MPKITFRQMDGAEQVVDCLPGGTLMQSAVDAMVEGILAECGGACACATCHILVDPEWGKILPAQESEEAMILDGAMHVTDTSRLSCQVKVTDDMDGMIGTIPESQF